MASLAGVVKPKTHKGRKFLERRAPKVVENDKQTLVLKGGHTSQVVNAFLDDLCALKNPLVCRLKWRNPVLPFDDLTFVEKMCKKYDCSLFVIGLHSKKRPHNIVIGRMHDGELLDMFELGITRYEGLESAKGAASISGAKPLLVFSGELFEESQGNSMLKSLLAEIFRGPTVEKIRTLGVEHHIHFSMVAESKVAMRVRRISFKPVSKAEPAANSAAVPDERPKLHLRTPWGIPLEVHVEESGPMVNFEVRRRNLPSEDKWKRAHRVPTETRMMKKKPKNRAVDVFGSRVGRVHVGKSEKLEALRPGASIRTALTGRRKRGFDRHQKSAKTTDTKEPRAKRVKQ
ncbi:unnamed protein product [Calicophoron daubneyi]|uniref:Ribosome production factor 2 homolog n=1 Tax=Calicophoron daubneyi TaxID=300641 RepID=A0AAV2TPL7_CALDB